MADEILIKVRADVDGLQADVQNAKKTLEQLELLDKEYKPKINFSNLQELQKSIIKISSSTGDIWDAAAFKKKISESVNDSKALNEIRNQFVQMANSADKTDASFDELIATIKGLDKQIEFLNNNPVEVKVDDKPMGSLRTQLRQATLEVAELTLKFGATSTEVAEASIRAGLLEDAIRDAQASIAAFNPDAKFRALTGSLQGVVGGFTAVQGAIGAFGVKSEEVEQALLKVNSAMALSQGLQSVGESVDSFKNLGAVIKNTTTFQSLYNAATTTATAVQTAFGVATNVTTTGFKLLRGAIISTGIGALVVGLGMVIANFDAISAWIKSSPLGEFANQVGNIVQKFTDFIGVTSESERSLDRLTKANARANESLNARIKILKAQGGSEQEVYKLSKQVIENNLNDVRNAAKVKGTLSAEEAKKIRELKVEELVLTAEYNKKISDDNKKANEKANEEARKRNEEAKKRNEETLKQQRELQKKENEIAFNAAQERQKILDEIENANYKNEFDRERQQIRDEFFLKIETNKELEAELIKLREARIAEVNKKEQEANKKTAEDQKKNIASVNIALGDAAQRGFETREEYEKRLFEEQKKNLNDILTFAQNGILLQIGINPQDVERVKSGILNAMDVIKANQKVLDDVSATAKEQSQARLENLQAISQTVASGITTISNSIFAADTQRRQEDLAALNAQKEEELRLAGDNEQKKDLIRQKYAIKEREIKRKQAEADKRKAIFDAIVGTAVAVIGALPNFVLAAIVGALGAAQIALIAAQPIPKFAKGGAVPSSDINGMISGRPHAAGGVLIEAEGNEFITRRSQAMKGDNLGLLEAINMSDSERDAYINRHYVMPALQAKESQAAQNYRSSIIEAENNLIARVSSHTLKSIHREQKNTTDAIKGLAKKDYTW